MITTALKTLSRFALILFVLTGFSALAGCGAGGGGSVGNIPPVPTITAPDIPVVNAPTQGPTVVSNGTAVALNAQAPPTAPSSRPPLVTGAKATRARTQSAGAVTLQLSPGWNQISFPFSSLQSASGFTYQLYTFAQGSFIAVDPVNTPGVIDTRFGYLAYSDFGEVVTVNGPANTGQVTEVPLVQGWNLVGCPSSSNLPYARMSARRLGVTRVLDEVATMSMNPDATWILQYAYGYNQGMMLFDDLLGAGAALPTTQSRWVFAWQDTTLNLNVVPPTPLPAITSLSTSSLTPGQALTINGSGFGTSDVGAVTLGGVLVPPSSITSWTATAISLTIPAGAVSGYAVVFVNGFPSNRVSVTSGGGGGGGLSSLSGQVQDTSGNPLSGAQILMDSGQFAVSDANGSFSIANIPPGDHLVMVTRLGYNVGSGTFTFVANVNKTVLVQLSPLSGGGGGGGGGTGGGGGATQGTLYVKAYPYTSGVRYHVSNITVSEYNNYSRRWSQSWYQDLGETYWSLTCSSAPVGAWYVIRITYKHPTNGSTLSGSWYAKLDSTSQTETHYGPYSKMVEVAP